MSRRGRAGCIAALGVRSPAVIVHFVDRDNTSDDLALLAAGLVLGELLVLRLEDRSGGAAVVRGDDRARVVVRGGRVRRSSSLGAELVAFFVVPRDNEPMGGCRVLCSTGSSSRPRRCSRIAA